MVNWVIKDWISSQVSIKSDVKKMYLLQLPIASWWSGVLMCLCKKAVDKQLKIKKVLTFCYHFY